jgi:NAD(P)H-nitrite reductase large subunit
MHKKSYIVIGSSAAGMAACNKLRDLDANSSITCITTETRMPYNRCLIADVLASKKTTDGISTKTATFFEEKKIELLLGSTVTAIEPKAKTVTLHNGTILPYDKLLIATGRSGWVIPIPGSRLQGVMPFYGLDDVATICDYGQQGAVKNVVIIGAGLSGLECADALQNKGWHITVIERESKVLPQQLNADGSNHLIGIMAQAGITVITNTTITSIAGSTHVEHVVLSTGKIVAADLVIFATGGRTNSTLAANAGITLNDGAIDVNSKQETSIPDIFAAGDVASVVNQLLGTKMQSCLWSDAAKQGMVAASNMTGIEACYAGSVMVTSSTIFNTTFVTAGPITKPPAGLKLLVKKSDAFYHALLIDQANILQGFALIGNVDNVGALRKKLTEKIPLF